MCPRLYLVKKNTFSLSTDEHSQAGTDGGILCVHLTLSVLLDVNMSIAQAQFWSVSMNVLYWIREKGSKPSLRKQTGSERFRGSRAQGSGKMLKTKRIPLTYALLRAYSIACSGGRRPIFVEDTNQSGQDRNLLKILRWKQTLTTAPTLNFALPTRSPRDPMWKRRPFNWSSWLWLTRIFS